ncbi:MAG TPA: S24 family peptidase [Burkholderiales bacterium]|nr:S24 family peptidase [Burkholderiales bacterium]
MSLGKNIRSLRIARKMTLEQLAGPAGTDPTNLSRLERDRQGHSTALLNNIAATFHVTVADLFDDSRIQSIVDKIEGRVISSPADYVAIPGGGDVSEEDYVEVRRIAAAGSCGGGRLNHFPEDEKPLVFRRDWLAKKGVSPANAFVMYADGDSQADFIVDGDVVLFDKSKVEIRSGNIYAIEHPDGTKIKEIFRQIDGALVLTSRNPDKRRFPDERVSPDQVSLVRVLGEFVWRGGG